MGERESGRERENDELVYHLSKWVNRWVSKWVSEWVSE